MATEQQKDQPSKPDPAPSPAPKPDGSGVDPNKRVDGPVPPKAPE